MNDDLPNENEDSQLDQPTGVRPENESFDPDSYLSQNQTEAPKTQAAFDPDSYLSAAPTEKKEAPQSFDPDLYLQGYSNKYETPGQKALTAAEGAAQGVLGPLATGAELGLSKLGVPGISAEEISARKQANPILSAGSEAAGLGASLATGIGEAGLASKAAAQIAPEALGRIGQKALANGIATGLIQGGDEISKALLGQGNPSEATSNILGLGALGLLTGGIGEGVAKAVPKIAETTNKRLYDFISLLADPSHLGAETGFVGGLSQGDNWMDRAKNALYGSAAGYATGKGLGLAAKYATPMILKAASSAENALSPEAIDSFLTYGGKLANGENVISNSLNGLFKSGATPSLDALRASESDRKKLDNIVSNGGAVQQFIDNQQSQAPQGFAEGGEVSPTPNTPNHLANHFPEQAVLLNAAKARITNYLNTQRPAENQPKLAFDDKPDQTQQKKSYDRALNIAINPMSIMGQIKSGRVEPEDVRHFNSMYPDLKDHLQQKLTEKITQQQMAGQKPSQNVRQGLSLFMGTPLSAEVTPAHIMAAQSVFANKPAPPPQPGQAEKSKKKTSTLSKASSQYETAAQSRIQNQQKN